MGYIQTEIRQYWKDIKDVLNNVNNKQCLIWATDNNGQIAKNPDGKQQMKFAPGHMLKT